MCKIIQEISCPAIVCLSFKVDLPFGVIRSEIHFNNTATGMVSQNKSKKKKAQKWNKERSLHSGLAGFLPSLLSAY